MKKKKANYPDDIKKLMQTSVSKLTCIDIYVSSHSKNGKISYAFIAIYGSSLLAMGYGVTKEKNDNQYLGELSGLMRAVIILANSNINLTLNIHYEYPGVKHLITSVLVPSCEEELAYKIFMEKKMINNFNKVIFIQMELESTEYKIIKDFAIKGIDNTYFISNI